MFSLLHFTKTFSLLDVLSFSATLHPRPSVKTILVRQNCHLVLSCFQIILKALLNFTNKKSSCKIKRKSQASTESDSMHVILFIR